jgi:RimJ/RimL family protein N-acetyltransferase
LGEAMEFYLRKAGWGDADLLFAWANDKDVRKNSFSERQITYEEHKSWFRKKILDRDTQVYLFCQGKQEKGMLRLEDHGNCVEISYSIAAGERGKGYGQKLILLAEAEICQRFQRRRGAAGSHAGQEKPQEIAAVARVKEENLASNRIFAKLGYEKHGTEYRKRIYCQ